MIITTTASVVIIPLATSLISTCAIFAISKLNQPPISSLDLRDTAGWNTSSEWLIGAPVEQEFKPHNRPNSCVMVAVHSNGRWRTLQRHGSVQSVTRWDSQTDKPLHHAMGNEYIKVMASAYAALQNDYLLDTDTDTDRQASHLHLGIGGGTLPMLLAHTTSPVYAIDIDPDVVTLATQYLGFNHDSHISVRVADALLHRDIVKEESSSSHSAIFVDVFGDDNNIPPAFLSLEFVQGLHERLNDGGVVVANFHRGTTAENKSIEDGKNLYGRIFGSCFAVMIRYQRNVVIAAVKGGGGSRDGQDLDVDKAK